MCPIFFRKQGHFDLSTFKPWNITDLLCEKRQFKKKKKRKKKHTKTKKGYGTSVRRDSFSLLTFGPYAPAKGVFRLAESDLAYGDLYYHVIF